MSIDGDANNNTLYGTTGDDVINGFAGNDVIHGSIGTDQVDGGEGFDTLRFTLSNLTYFTAPTDSQTYTITATSVTDSSGTINTSFTGVERVIFTTWGTGDFGDTIDASAFVSASNGWFTLQIFAGRGDDTIIGSAGSDLIFTGAGQNYVDSGAGHDRVTVDAEVTSGEVVYVTTSGGVVQTTVSGVVTNAVSNAEDVWVRAFSLDGGAVTIDASGVVGFTGMLMLGDSNGSDILIGSAGFDLFVNYDHATLGNDVYTGNGGADWYDYTWAVDAMDGDSIVDFDWDDVIDLQYNDAGGAAYGYEVADLFIGNAAFSGAVGEYRYEILGDQTLLQVDTDGDGFANETLTLANGGFALAETFAGSNVLQIAGNRVTGDELANSLTGTSGVDLIDGLAGADSMTGLGGNDIYYVDNSGDQITEASGGGRDRVNSTVSYRLGANVEMLTLTGVQAINATGNSAANTLVGNSARNILSGLGGPDVMRGEGGNDIYYVNGAGDTVIEDAGEGIDLIYSSVSYTLSDNVENMTLSGNGANSATGNALNNRLTGNGAANTLTGDAGNDTLNGRAGADAMAGGAGNDTYLVDNVADTITEMWGQGIDQVYSRVSYTLSAYVEKLTLTGTGAINGTGNAQGNTLIGNAGANVLRGQSGSDVIVGGGGADDIYGGLGADTLTGGLGADDFFFNTTLNGINFDKIKDFSAADDSIYLDMSVFGGLAGLGTLAAGAFHAGTAAADADDRIIYDSATGKLYYDADGNGAGAQVLFAQLVAGTAITNADFIAY